MTLDLLQRVALDRPGRDADHGLAGGDRLHDDGVGPDPGTVTDDDVAEDLGAGPDDDVVADGRVPLTALAAGAAERDLMIEVDVVADHGGLADHHAHAVIDHESAPDLRGGMDFDAGQPSRDMRREARR